MLGSGDVGRTVQVLVTATNSLGSATAASAPTAVIATPVSPSNTTPPVISGTAQDGQTLSASTGTWTATPSPTYTYQWQSCNGSGEACSNISGATSPTYVLGHGDVGTTLRVRVEATNFAGSAASTSEATGVVVALAPSNIDATGNLWRGAGWADTHREYRCMERDAAADLQLPVGELRQPG